MSGLFIEKLLDGAEVEWKTLVVANKSPRDTPITPKTTLDSLI